MELKKEEKTQGGGEPQKVNPGDDINVNLGKFGSDKIPEMVTPEPTLAVQSANEALTKEKKFKIDFEKFNRRKQAASKTALGLKMDIWLRTRKSFIIIWLIIIGIVVTVLITQVTMPIFVNKAIHANNAGSKLDASTGKASIILSYISLAFLPLPFLFLLTTWIVGVNGVAKSRTFHYVLWFMLLVSVVCMLTGIACGGYVLSDVYSFKGSW